MCLLLTVHKYARPYFVWGFEGRTGVANKGSRATLSIDNTSCEWQALVILADAEDPPIPALHLLDTGSLECGWGTGKDSQKSLDTNGAQWPLRRTAKVAPAVPAVALGQIPGSQILVQLGANATGSSWEYGHPNALSEPQEKRPTYCPGNPRGKSHLKYEAQSQLFWAHICPGKVPEHSGPF